MTALPLNCPPLQIMDAAMGTRLIAQGLNLAADDPCLWNLSRPEDVEAVHLADLQAGAQFITTNSFGANKAWLSKLSKRSEFMSVNRAAVTIARNAISLSGLPQTKIVGSIGPTALTDALSVQSQLELLWELGVDHILIETLDATLINTLVHSVARQDRPKVWVSFWQWGPAPVETAGKLADAGFRVWGSNCISQLKTILDVHRQLNLEGVPARIVKPSAMPMDQLTSIPEQLIPTGLIYLGGCCGTDHGSIQAWTKHA